MKRIAVIYDLNGIDEIFGYADNSEELKVLLENCVEDGIIEFKCAYV